MINKAFGYARLSTEEDEKGCYPSIKEQKAQIEAYSRKIGFKKVHFFHDEPIEKAGLIDVSLGGIFSLLDTIIQQKVYFVIVNSLDRLDIKEVDDTDFYVELIRRNKQILTVGQDFTLYSADEYMDAYTDDSGAEIKYGRHQSGPVPYGYRKNTPGRGQKPFITPDVYEAEVVKMIYREYEAKKSFAEVQRMLEAKEIPTRRGKGWSRAGLSWLLRNDIYLGVSRASPDDEPKESHKALIGKDQYDRVQGIIKKRQRKRKKKREF